MGRQPRGRRTSAEEEEEEDRDCEGKEHTHGAFKDSGDCWFCSFWGLSWLTEGTATLLCSERCLPRVHPMKVTRWCSESALNGWNTPQPPCQSVSQPLVAACGPESVDVLFLTFRKRRRRIEESASYYLVIPSLIHQGIDIFNLMAAELWKSAVTISCFMSVSTSR